MLQRAVFLDRDGTLNVDTGHPYRVEDLVVKPGVIEGLRRLQEAGFKLVVISNQNGIAKDIFSVADMDRFNDALSRVLQGAGIRWNPKDAFYYCPHNDSGSNRQFAIRCDCHKPSPLLVYAAAGAHGIDLSESYMIGDKATDILTAVNARLRGGALIDESAPQRAAQFAKQCTHLAVVRDFAAAVDVILNDRGRIAGRKIRTRDEALAVREHLRKLGQKVAFTSGAFDLVHAGHVAYLESAKDLCDFLFVGVNTDSSIRTYKGADRPIVQEMQRAKVIAALSAVDFVFLFDETNNNVNASLLKPDLYIKAGDYDLSNLTSRAIVEKHGGTVVLIPLKEDISSSSIIAKIQSRK